MSAETDYEKQCDELKRVVELCDKHGKGLVELLLWQDRRIAELNERVDGWIKQNIEKADRIEHLEEELTQARCDHIEVQDKRIDELGQGWISIDMALPEIGSWITLYASQPDWFESVKYCDHIDSVLRGIENDMEYSDYTHWKFVSPPEAK